MCLLCLVNFFSLFLSLSHTHTHTHTSLYRCCSWCTESSSTCTWVGAALGAARGGGLSARSCVSPFPSLSSIRFVREIYVSFHTLPSACLSLHFAPFSIRCVLPSFHLLLCVLTHSTGNTVRLNWIFLLFSLDCSERRQQ